MLSSLQCAMAVPCNAACDPNRQRSDVMLKLLLELPAGRAMPCELQTQRGTAHGGN
jgi:hypothetical protein